MRRKYKSKLKEQNYKVNYYVNEKKEYYYINSFEEVLKAKFNSVVIKANTYNEINNEVNKSMFFIPLDYSIIFSIYEESKEIKNNTDFMYFRDLGKNHEQVNVEIKPKCINKKRRHSCDEKMLIKYSKLEDINTTSLNNKFSAIKAKTEEKEKNIKQIKIFQTYKIYNQKGRTNKLFKIQSYHLQPIEDKFQLNNECPIICGRYYISYRPYTLKELCLLIESHLLAPIKYDLLFKRLTIKEDKKYREHIENDNEPIKVTIRKAYEKEKKRRNSIGSYSINDNELLQFKYSLEAIKKHLIEKYDKKIESRKDKEITREAQTKTLRPLSNKLVKIAPVRIHQIPGKAKQNK